jgi:CRISPR-associated RAMP protein (TIGR02581 family)
MFDTFKNRLEITGKLTTITALRISAGRSTEPIGTDLPVIKDALGQPLIPGSSFKGALRSRLESFLRGIDDSFAANPAIESEWSITSNEFAKIKGLNLEQLLILLQLQITEDFKNLSVGELIKYIQNKNLRTEDEIEDERKIQIEKIIRIREFNLNQLITLYKVWKAKDFINRSFIDVVEHIESGYLLSEKELEKWRNKYSKDLLFTLVIQYNTDLISQLFGSPWIASKFQVRDLTVVPDTWFGQYQERDGVSIDRDTETAADGKLYDFQVVPASTHFAFRAVVENAEPWELGLLMIGLHQFETEQIPLGGGRSRGLGVVKLNIDKMLWVDVEDNPQFLLQYLQKMVMGDATAYEDAADYKDEWVHQFIEYLNKNISQKTSTTTTAES